MTRQWNMGRLALGVGSAVLLASTALAGVASARTRVQTITYWSMWNPGEPQQVVLQQEINAFQKAYPDIHVQVEWDGRQVLTKVEHAILAGHPPDLTDQSGGEVAGALVTKGLATPVTAFLHANVWHGKTPLMNAFLGSTINQYKYKGQYYFLPYEFITGGIWYNTVLFKKDHIGIPTTWPELLSMAGKFKKLGIAPFALDGNTTSYDAYWYNWLVARLVGPSALLQAASDPTGKAWSNPGLLQAANMEETLIKDGYFEPGYAGSIWPAAQVGWAQGRSAAILLFDWITSETQKYAGPNFHYAMFPFPQAGKGKATDVPSYLIGFVIPKHAPNLSATKTFLSYLLTAQHLKGIATSALNFTDLKGDPTPSTLTSIEPVLRHATSFYDPHGGIYAYAAAWTSTVYFPTNAKFVYGQLTPKQFIASLRQQTVNFLKIHHTPQ